MPIGLGVDPMQVIYVIAALNSLALTGVLWRHRDRRGALPLCGVNMGAGLWALALLAVTSLESGLIALLFFALVFVGVCLSSVAMLVFTLEYTGRERYVTRPVLAALSIEPTLVVLFVLVNPRNLFFTLTETGVEWGIAFELHTLYSYGILAVVTGLMLEFLYRSRSLYRGQSAALLGGALATWIANAAYIVGPFEVDTSPIGFVAAGILYTIAIVRYRLIDITPIARDRILETVTDGVFVVGERDRVIDANPAGRLLLADVEGSPIGERVDSLFADWPELREEYRSLTATPETTERELEVEGEHYLVRTTPIEDGRDRHVGWLFVVRDVTERKRREQRLERQNERLEEFASIVSHDLRNPLTVADGYLELAREADDPDPHLDEVERAHERMETIIEDVLTLAREGTEVTDPEPVDLESIAERSWTGVETGDATLTIRSSAAISADADRLRRLFENLFRNSIEHGTEREDAADLEITVAPIDHPSGTIRGFYVADDGPGIPPEQCDRIFEAGYTTDEDGTGFGLSIVQGIAEAHGWSVAVTSGDSGGVRFEFTGIETDDSSADPEPAARGTSSVSGR